MAEQEELVAGLVAELMLENPQLTIEECQAAVAESMGGRTVVAGEGNARCLIHGVDAFGNAKTGEGLVTSFSATATAGGHFESADIAWDAEENAFVATFGLTAAGAWSVSAAIAGEALPRSSTVEVTPAAISVADSAVSCPADGTVGSKVLCTLYTRDRYETATPATRAERAASSARCSGRRTSSRRSCSSRAR